MATAQQDLAAPATPSGGAKGGSTGNDSTMRSDMPQAVETGSTAPPLMVGASAAAATEPGQTSGNVQRWLIVLLIFVAMVGLAFYGGMVYQNHLDQPLFHSYHPPTQSASSIGSGGNS
jgi:hypothetical protein